MSTLREPLWTRDELEQFWSVFEPQIKRLLNGDLTLPDPAAGLDLMSRSGGKRLNDKLKTTYIFGIHTDLWSGRYSRAVADFKALAALLGRSMSTDDHLHALKLIYLQPYRQQKTARIQTTSFY
ncbi:uncharacterized protein LOC134196629 [Corticium candelabrum]|uniref:uncharacterized protein LOC134196629 n=1 Tax=Corticium candelabrum TaxID=121492 RepID=UPI002E26E180|nr:uncharacterized protein LOC134196629 [Corticium candelabrum]